MKWPEQGKDTPADRVPGLNIERVYTTTVPAKQFARALADHFRAPQFEAQIFRTGRDPGDAGARGEPVAPPARVGYALTVLIGLVAVPPVLLGIACGIWKENQLDKEVWQVIDEWVSSPTEACP